MVERYRLAVWCLRSRGIIQREVNTSVSHPKGLRSPDITITLGAHASDRVSSTCTIDTRSRVLLMSVPEPEILTRLNELNDRFEDELRAGKSPRIEEWLNEVPDESRQALLEQLLRLELEVKRAKNPHFDTADYLQRFAAYPSVVELVLLETHVDPTTGVDASGWQSDSAPATPHRIGPYRLIELLGEGGMGVVYKAEQTKPVRRMVAIKLIRSGQQHREVHARFEAERQSLALMEHPHIATVLDAGETDQGWPFYVMELVDGVSITKHCNDNQLTISQRIELLADACDAIQHAHQKGIIHRDLKPSNVLVSVIDGQPSVKVIDFGLAKSIESSIHLTDKTMATEFGQLMGTLLYMSPEQASLDPKAIDTRTDVYALGVMLFELLIGQTPIRRSRIQEETALQVLDAIRSEIPPRVSKRLSECDNQEEIAARCQSDVSQLQSALQGDLDWIVAKSLEHDLGQRYQSAETLRDDLIRFAEGEPVEARPPSFRYLASKFVGRNRLLVTSTAIIFAVLVAGIASTTWFAIQANRDAKLARQQSQLSFETVSDVVKDLAEGLKDVPGGNGMRRRLLSTAVEKMDRISTRYLEAAPVSLQTIRTLDEMGDVLREAGDGQQGEVIAASLRFYDRAASIGQQLTNGDSENTEFIIAYADTLNRIGLAKMAQRDAESAIDAHLLEYEMRQTAMRISPDDQDQLYQIASALRFLGNANTFLGRFDDAEPNLLDMLAVSRRLVLLDPSSIHAKQKEAAALSLLGMLEWVRKAETPALEYFLEGREILVEAGVNEDSPAYIRELLGKLQTWSGMALQAHGRIGEAHESMCQGVETLHQRFVSHPQNVKAGHNYAKALTGLGNTLRELGKLEESLAAHQQAVGILQANSSQLPDDVEAADAINHATNAMALTISLLGHDITTNANDNQTRQARDSILDDTARNTPASAKAFTLLLIAEKYRYGDIEAGVEYLESALEIYQKTLGSDHLIHALDPNVGTTLTRLSEYSLRLDRKEELQRFSRQAVRFWKNYFAHRKVFDGTLLQEHQLAEDLLAISAGDDTKIVEFKYKALIEWVDDQPEELLAYAIGRRKSGYTFYKANKINALLIVADQTINAVRLAHQSLGDRNDVTQCLAQSLDLRAKGLRAEKKFPETLDALLEASQWLVSIHGENFPSSVNSGGDGWILNDTVLAGIQANRRDIAANWAEPALAVWQRIKRESPDSPGTDAGLFSSVSRYANLYLDSDRRPETIELIRDTIKLIANDVERSRILRQRLDDLETPAKK